MPGSQPNLVNTSASSYMHKAGPDFAGKHALVMLHNPPEIPRELKNGVWFLLWPPPPPLPCSFLATDRTVGEWLEDSDLCMSQNGYVTVILDFSSYKARPSNIQVSPSALHVAASDAKNLLSGLYCHAS